MKVFIHLGGLALQGVYFFLVKRSFKDRQTSFELLLEKKKRGKKVELKTPTKLLFEVKVKYNETLKWCAFSFAS